MCLVGRRRTYVYVGLSTVVRVQVCTFLKISTCLCVAACLSVGTYSNVFLHCVTLYTSMLACVPNVFHGHRNNAMRNPDRRTDETPTLWPRFVCRVSGSRGRAGWRMETSGHVAPRFGVAWALSVAILYIPFRSVADLGAEMGFSSCSYKPSQVSVYGCCLLRTTIRAGGWATGIRNIVFPYLFRS